MGQVPLYTVCGMTRVTLHSHSTVPLALGFRRGARNGRRAFRALEAPYRMTEVTLHSMWDDWSDFTQHVG